MVFDQFLYHCFYNETYNPPVAPVAAASLPPEAEKTHPPGQGNTVALKDGTAPKSSPKSP